MELLASRSLKCVLHAAVSCLDVAFCGGDKLDNVVVMKCKTMRMRHMGIHVQNNWHLQARWFEFQLQNSTLDEVSGSRSPHLSVMMNIIQTDQVQLRLT